MNLPAPADLTASAPARPDGRQEPAWGTDRTQGIDANPTSQGALPLDIPAEPLGWLPVSLCRAPRGEDRHAVGCNEYAFASRAAWQSEGGSGCPRMPAAGATAREQFVRFQIRVELGTEGRGRCSIMLFSCRFCNVHDADSRICLVGAQIDAPILHKRHIARSSLLQTRVCRMTPDWVFRPARESAMLPPAERPVSAVPMSGRRTACRGPVPVLHVRRCADDA